MARGSGGCDPGPPNDTVIDFWTLDTTIFAVDLDPRQMCRWRWGPDAARANGLAMLEVRKVVLFSEPCTTHSDQVGL